MYEKEADFFICLIVIITWGDTFYILVEIGLSKYNVTSWSLLHQNSESN